MSSMERGEPASRRRMWVGLFMVVSSAISGCSDPAAPSEPDLRGTWNAETAVATNPAQPSEQHDLIAAGISVQLIVEDGGTTELRSSLGAFTEIERGSISTSNGSVTLVLEGEASAGTYSLTGDALSLDLRTGFRWDFDDDGDDEPATMLMSLRRER